MVKKFLAKHLKPGSCPSTIVSFNVKTYAIFCVSLIVVYALYRKVAGYFDLEHREKSAALHLQDCVQLLVYGTMAYVFGNYSNTFNMVTFASMVVGALVFGFFGKLKFMQNSLAGYKDWTKKAWVVYGTGFFLIFVIIIYISYVAKHCKTLKTVIAPIIPAVLVMPMMIAFKASNEKIHPHHWQIFWVLSFVTRFDSTASRILGGIFLGIFTQGISAYGPDWTVG